MFPLHLMFPLASSKKVDPADLTQVEFQWDHLIKGLGSKREAFLKKGRVGWGRPGEMVNTYGNYGGM